MSKDLRLSANITARTTFNSTHIKKTDPKKITTRNKQVRQLQDSNSIQGNCTGNEIQDCIQTEKCFPSSWVQDGFCDDGTNPNWGNADLRCYDQDPNGAVIKLKEGQIGRLDGGDCGVSGCNEHESVPFKGHLDLSSVNGSYCEEYPSYFNATKYKQVVQEHGNEEICDHSECITQDGNINKYPYTVKDVQAINGSWSLAVPVDNNGVHLSVKTEGAYDIYSDNGDKIYFEKNKTAYIPLTSIKNIPGINITSSNNTHLDLQYFTASECVVMNNIPTNGNDLILPSDSTGLTRLSFGNNLMYAIPAGNRLFINGSTSANITSFIETNFQSFSVDEECLAMNKECDSDQTKITCGGGSWTYEIAVKLQDANLNQIFYKQCPFSYCLPNSESNFLNVSIFDNFGDGMNGNELTIGSQASITFDKGHFYNVIFAGGSLNPTTPPTPLPTLSPPPTPAPTTCSSDKMEVTCGGGFWQYEIDVKLQDANQEIILYEKCPFSDCLPNELNFLNVSISDSFGDGMNGNVLKVGTQVITFDHGHYYNVIYAGGSLNPTPPPTREPTRGARTLFPTKAPSGQSNGNEKEVEEISLPIVFFSLGLSILVCYCFYLKYLGYTRTPLNEDEPVHNPMAPDEVENIESGNPIINNKSTTDTDEGDVLMADINKKESEDSINGSVDHIPEKEAAGGDQSMNSDELFNIDLESQDPKIAG